MGQKTQQRLSLVVGAFLLSVSVGVVALTRGAFFENPFLAVQTAMIAAAGVFDIAAGFETRITKRVAWYKLSGLGNVLLGFSLPFGSVGTTEPLPLVLTVLGGTGIGVMGLDMLLFDGRHFYSDSLSE